MSKLKRPVYKYKIIQEDIKNVHTGEILKTTYSVKVKNITTWGNSWKYLDIYATDEQKYPYSDYGYNYDFKTLEHAKSLLNDFIKSKRANFEAMTKKQWTTLEEGIL